MADKKLALGIYVSGLYVSGQIGTSKEGKDFGYLSVSVGKAVYKIYLSGMGIGQLRTFMADPSFVFGAQVTLLCGCYASDRNVVFNNGEFVNLV